MSFGKAALFFGGALFGSAGLKILSRKTRSRSMKRVRRKKQNISRTAQESKRRRQRLKTVNECRRHEVTVFATGWNQTDRVQCFEGESVQV